MNNENICFSSKTIELAENENYIELTNRLCYYTEPNLNGVALIYDELSEEKAQTLVDMPVVAKYTTNVKGEPTFKGHEVYYDEDGNLYFGTDNIGTHTETYIKEDNVVIDLKGTTKVLPCLFAKYRVWKRNQNVVDAIHRLYDLDKLYSSWEIQTISYTYNNGIKTLTDYVFLSNCLLGYENSYPAYGEDAKGIQMSQKESQLLVAEAFSKDIIEHSVSNINTDNKKEDEILPKEKENKVEETEATIISETVVEEVKVEVVNENELSTENVIDEVKETSALTDFDLRKALRKAIADKLNFDEWDFYILYNFPVDFTIWIQKWNADSELDIIQFTYTVENDIITVSEPVEAKLTVSVAQINNTVAELTSKVEALTNSIVEASSKIQEANKQIVELKPFKDAADIAEQQRIEDETTAKRESLKAYATKSGFIENDEFSSNETIKNCIDNVDESGIKAIIAERFVASLDNKTDDIETSSVKSTEKSEVEVSQSKPNINDNDENIGADYKSIMKSYIGK